MLSSFLIALREGLEASLIIGILLAYIVKTGRSNLIPALWGGVSAAIGLSFALGGFLNFTSAELTPRGEELFAGTTSLVAVALVTGMVFWMKETSRALRDELHGKVERAAKFGSFAMASAAFFAVAREGLETALFLYSNFKVTGSKTPATIGLVAGLVLSISLGYLIYKRAIRINLSKFFTVTGVALVVVSAGVLSYAVHEFQELGWLPGVDAFAWDLSGLIPTGSVIGSFLSGTIGFDPSMSWLQLVIWAGYLIGVLALYLKPAKTAPSLVAAK